MASTRLHLRKWQRAALDAFQTKTEPDFLAVATPGAGKTTFALAAARISMPTLPGRLVIVAPTRHLKVQWAESARRFGFSLMIDWSTGDPVPSDVHGVVATYQQIGSSPEGFFALSQGGFAIFDEVHHAGAERSWGDGIQKAFAASAKRLSLSGTPFRSDTCSIPFVKYHFDTAVPDYEYGYGDALADTKVVRPVFFPRYGGNMEWSSSDGSVVSASFEDELTKSLSNQRLRAALSLDGDWLPTVLKKAHAELLKVRQNHKEAGGLVLATDKEHAHGIASWLRTNLQTTPVVVTSEDPKASEKIVAFSENATPWIVAVKMVSEGVDIPRLRVGVYATTTTTELFFRQAVGRLVRYVKSRGRQRAYMFVPDDPRLKHFGATIAESRRHSLKKTEKEEDDLGGELDSLSADDDGGVADQMNLFEVLSSTALETESADIFLEGADEESDAEPEQEIVLDESLVLDLGELPGLGIAGGSNGQVAGPKERERLRKVNASLASDLAKHTGMGHAEVNKELNKQAGITSIAQASVMKLNKRIRCAERWLKVVERKKSSSVRL